MTIVDAEPLMIDTEQRFSDSTYWRRLGEEHGSPLIVTGSVRLLLAPPSIVQRGPRDVYILTAGRVLEATVVLIDGRTGTPLSRQKLPSRMRYGSDDSRQGCRSISNSWIVRCPTGSGLSLEHQDRRNAMRFKPIRRA